MKNLSLLVLFTLFCLGAQTKTIHVFVALCDNENQGIVPVSKTLGNGQDLANNLYWGAMYGVKAYFKRSASWTSLEVKKNPETYILERVIYRHKVSKTILVEDAYDGAKIRRCTIDFFKACANQNKQIIKSEELTIGIGGSADLIVYVGHDGLMEFDLDNDFLTNE